jgi:hypothetical protein
MSQVSTNHAGPNFLLRNQSITFCEDGIISPSRHWENTSSDLMGIQHRVYRSTLTSTLVGDNRSVSRPGRVTPGTYWIKDWMGPRTVVDDVDRRKISPYRDSNFHRSASQPVTSHYTYWAIPTPSIIRQGLTIIAMVIRIVIFVVGCGGFQFTLEVFY